MKTKKGNTGSSSDPAYALVYSTDALPAQRCSGCSRPLTECLCKKGTLVTGFKPAIRIERKGRGGKSVTLITKLPAHESFLEELCTYIKRKLGTGGTSYLDGGEGVIEIHGERKEAVLNLVLDYQKSGYKSR